MRHSELTALSSTELSSAALSSTTLSLITVLVLALCTCGLPAAGYAQAAESTDQTADGATVTPAKAKVSSEHLAVEASNVQNDHCADAASKADTGGLRSISTVSNTWVRVSERYDLSGESYLLYWRGVLAQCMDQEERALTDLKQFITRSEGNSLWAALIKDAQRRVRQLDYKTGGGGRGGPIQATKVFGFVLGASLAAASGGAGIAAASFWSQSQEHAVFLLDEERSGLKDLPEYEQGQVAARNSSAATVAAIGLGVVAVVSFVVAAGPGSSPTAALAPPLILPTTTGAVVSWGTRF